MLRIQLLCVSLLLLTAVLPARAEDGAPAPTRKVVDMEGYRTEPAAGGPRLSVAPDLIASGVHSDSGQMWVLERGQTWLPFGEPVLEMRAVGVDTIAEVLRSTIAHQESLAQAFEIESQESRVILGGPADAVNAVAAHVPWALAGLAPALRADAVLTASSTDGDVRLRAMGGVKLWPGRWTRLYLDARELACTPNWDLEVAQEATIMDPNPVGVVEGRELYARYHPGETVSLVEIWAGEVEHVELVRHDLSALRNVPEANGLGVVSYPRSSVNRAYTQILLPAGRATAREIRWTNGGVTSRLALRFGAAPSSVPLLARGEGNALALLRAGAVAAQLDFGTRAAGTEAWSERISARLYEAGAKYETEQGGYEFSVSPVDGGEIFFLEALPAELPAARALLVSAEKALSSRNAHLRVLTVPEAPWRSACIEGLVGVGRGVPPALLARLREAGASAGESLTLPALVGTPLGFRVGRSVPGIIDYDPELAQQAAGMHPVSSARFAGIFGELRVRAKAGGHAVRVRGSYCWASNDMRAVEIAVRPPVSMQGAPDNALDHPPAKYMVNLPLLSGGHAPLGVELDLPEGASRDVLLHSHVHGDEVTVVLLSLD